MLETARVVAAPGRWCLRWRIAAAFAHRWSQLRAAHFPNISIDSIAGGKWNVRFVCTALRRVVSNNPVPTQKSIRALAPLQMSSLCFAGLPRGQVCPTDNGNQRAGSRWRSRRQACGSSFAAGEVAASQAARRSYRWWSPPRIGRPTIFTPRSGRWTSLRSGASLLSERWVRVLL